MAPMSASMMAMHVLWVMEFIRLVYALEAINTDTTAAEQTDRSSYTWFPTLNRPATALFVA